MRVGWGGVWGVVRCGRVGGVVWCGRRLSLNRGRPSMALWRRRASPRWSGRAGFFGSVPAARAAPSARAPPPRRRQLPVVRMTLVMQYQDGRWWWWAGTNSPAERRPDGSCCDGANAEAPAARARTTRALIIVTVGWRAWRSGGAAGEICVKLGSNGSWLGNRSPCELVRGRRDDHTLPTLQRPAAQSPLALACVDRPCPTRFQPRASSPWTSPRWSRSLSSAARW